MKKILFVGHDRGGCNAILPIYRRLADSYQAEVRGVFNEIAKDVVPTDGNAISVKPELFGEKELVAEFDAFRPDFVMVGTSEGPTMDKIATKIAGVRSIPTITILDFMGNYEVRFSDPGTTNMKYLPTRIFAINETMVHDMAAVGVPAERILVTGNPHFDQYRVIPMPLAGEGIITFFSQPFSELGKEISFGYDERGILRDILEAYASLNLTTQLVIRNHPKTKNKQIFDEMLKESGVNARVDEAMTTDEAIAKSSLILGMNSTTLFEAALVGRPVVSYQPGLSKKDPLISNSLGLSIAVYHKKDLAPAIERALKPEHVAEIQRIRAKLNIDNAAERVLTTLHKLKFL